MSVITPEFINAFEKYKLHPQRQLPDPFVIKKLIHPPTGKTWFLIEYDKYQATAFGYVSEEKVWREIKIQELAAYHRPNSIKLEFETDWEPTRFSLINL